MAIVVLILVTLVFAILHSILARLAIKSRIRAAIGARTYEGWYRFVYNVFAVITFTPVLLVLAAWPGPDVWDVQGIWVWLFRAVQVVGLVGLTVSLLQVDTGRFIGTKQVRAYLSGEPLPLPNEPLRTDGVYGLVRHPLYLFSLMVLWFTPNMTLNWLVFVVMATVYFVVGSLFEERTMSQLFGDTYTRYQKHVPWLIPFVK